MIAVEHRRGSALRLHGVDPNSPDDAAMPAVPTVRLCEVEQPALVLGSRHRAAHGAPDFVDTERCGALGIELVTRRSGGGAVLLVPGEVIWIDVFIPVDHDLYEADVRRSMLVAGGWWRRALDEIGGLDPPPEVHLGPEATTAWSSLVCFAGLGPGELTHEGRKLVGISQRRTGAGSRLQALIHLVHDPADTESLVRPEFRPAAPLPAAAVLPVASTCGSPATVAAALSAALATVLETTPVGE